MHTILEEMLEVVENEMLHIAYRLKDLHSIDCMRIPTSRSRVKNYIEERYMYVPLEKQFKVEKERYENFCEELVTITDNTEEFDIDNVCYKNEDYFYFILTIDCEINMDKSFEENEKIILKKKFMMDYLCGMFSEIV